MKKRILAIFMTVILMVSFAACRTSATIEANILFSASDHVNGMEVRLINDTGTVYHSKVEKNVAVFKEIPNETYDVEVKIANYWLPIGEFDANSSTTSQMFKFSSFFEGGNVFFEGVFNDLPIMADDVNVETYDEYYRAIKTMLKEDAWFAMKITLAPNFNLGAQNYGVGYRFMVEDKEYNLLLVWKNSDHCFSLRLAQEGTIGGDFAEQLPAVYDRLINADDDEGYKVPSEELTGLYLIANYKKESGTFGVYLAMSDKSDVYHLKDIITEGGNITQFGVALWIRKKTAGYTYITDLRYGTTLEDALDIA